MVLKSDNMVKKCNAMCIAFSGIVTASSSNLPEDRVVCLMSDVCNQDLREHLELITKNMEIVEVRNEILHYVERKRSVVNGQFVAMDVGAIAGEDVL